MWPERGSNHSGEKPNGLRVSLSTRLRKPTIDCRYSLEVGTLDSKIWIGKVSKPWWINMLCLCYSLATSAHSLSKFILYWFNFSQSRGFLCYSSSLLVCQWFHLWCLFCHSFFFFFCSFLLKVPREDWLRDCGISWVLSPLFTNTLWKHAYSNI